MATHELRKRANWQTISGTKALGAEKLFQCSLQSALDAVHHMDFAIRNIENGKILFGEIKRQDGWIETTSMQAGRGNAHERSCKYFTPGLMKVLRESSGLSEEILPFWLVIVGDITRDPRRNREIAFWFQNYTKNYYMWRDTNNVKELLDFFENNLLPYLI